MKHINNELRRYLVHQIVEYVYEQTIGGYVSAQKIRSLEKGVTNICKSAFGPEYSKLAQKESSRILRATLNMGQLGIGGKVLKLMDNTQFGGSSAVSTILNEINNTRSPAGRAPINPAHNPWTARINAERRASVVAKDRMMVE